MSNLKSIEAKGIPLGVTKEALAPVLRAFGDKGIIVNRSTVGRLRGQDTSGSLLVEKLECAETLASGQAVLKNNFYLNVSNVGFANIRHGRNHGQAPEKLISVGFTERMGEDLGITSQIVRLILRAQRVDLLFHQTANPDPVIKDLFGQVAEKYIADYTDNTRGNASPAVSRIERDWDGLNIDHFYRVFYGLNLAAVSMGTWVPYEVSVLQKFYETQRERGNPLSDFDRRVLYTRIKSEPEDELVDDIRKITGIKIDREAVTTHRNILVFGRA